MPAAPVTPTREQSLLAEFSLALADLPPTPTAPATPTRALLATEFRRCLLQLQHSPLASHVTRCLAADVLSPAPPGPAKLFASPIRSPSCRSNKRSASSAMFPAPTPRKPRRDLPLASPLLVSQVDCPPSLTCDAHPLRTTPAPPHSSPPPPLCAKPQGPLPLAAVRRRATQLLRALDCLHREGRVHGGIAPATVLITSDGTLELTPPMKLQPDVYTAPEYPGTARPAADLWSVGLLLLKWAGGVNPFEHVPPLRATARGSPADHERHCAALLALSLRTVPAAGPDFRWLACTVTRCCRYIPEARWSASQLLCAPDFVDCG